MAPIKLRKKPVLTRVFPRLIRKRPETPESIKKTLKPIEQFDFESGSDVSDISDAFEGYHPDTYLLTKTTGEKPMSLMDANKKIVENFTRNHKKIVSEIREEMKINDNNITNETMEDIIKAFEAPRQPQNLPETVMEEIKTLLEECDVNFPQSHTSNEHPIIRTPSYDADSGVWKMLMVVEDTKKFTITPPNYNAHKQDELHWLDRESVPRDVMDESKMKCARWLERSE